MQQAMMQREEARRAEITRLKARAGVVTANVEAMILGKVRIMKLTGKRPGMRTGV
jgi:hypothetical protein